MQRVNECPGGCGQPRIVGDGTICDSDECFRNYYLGWLDKRLRQGTKLETVGDHLIWRGGFTKSPVISVHTMTNKHKTIRLIDALRIRNGEDIIVGDAVSDPECGEERCVNPAHHSIRHYQISQNPVNPPRVELSKIRLDFKPIVRAVENLRRGRLRSNDEDISWIIPEPYQTMYDTAMSCKSKTISFLNADAFCCDVLEVHPIAIYGDAYFTGMDEE